MTASLHGVFDGEPTFTVTVFGKAELELWETKLVDLQVKIHLHL